MQHKRRESSSETLARAPRPGGTASPKAASVPERLCLLVVDSRPLVRRIVIDISYDLGLQAAEAESAAEALELLGTAGGDGGGTMAPPAVLVVAVGSGHGQDGPVLVGEIARRRPGRRPPSVVYVGTHPSALRDHPLGEHERFLAEPFGRPALARAAHDALGWPVPRWLARGSPAAGTGL